MFIWPISTKEEEEKEEGKGEKLEQSKIFSLSQTVWWMSFKWKHVIWVIWVIMSSSCRACELIRTRNSVPMEIKSKSKQKRCPGFTWHSNAILTSILFQFFFFCKLHSLWVKMSETVDNCKFACLFFSIVRKNAIVLTVYYFNVVLLGLAMGTVSQKQTRRKKNSSSSKANRTDRFETATPHNRNNRHFNSNQKCLHFILTTTRLNWMQISTEYGKHL